MIPIIHVLIPHKEKPSYYTLYVKGNYSTKKDFADGVNFEFVQNSLLILYYTYPAHRRAYVVRFTGNDNTHLPGLSQPVKILLVVHASKVDKLKKAISFIQEHYFKPTYLPDLFYYRLEQIIKQKGKLNYETLHCLCQNHSKEITQ